MSSVERSIEIKALPERVWEMLAIDKWSEWMDGWKNAEYTSEVRKPKDKYKVGALAHITELNTRYDFKITESLENEKIAFLSKGKGVGLTMTITYILEPLEMGTKLTYAMDYEPPWGILGKALGKLTAGRIVERELKKLKGILEK